MDVVMVALPRPEAFKRQPACELLPLMCCFQYLKQAIPFLAQKAVDRTCTGSLLQCQQYLLQSTHATHHIHDDVGSAAEPDVVFSVTGVRRNELCLAAEAEWML